MKFALLFVYVILFGFLVFIWITSENDDINALIISGVFTLFGTGLGWALSEFSKRGRVKVYSIDDFKPYAKKVATGTSEQLARQGASGSSGTGKKNEQGISIDEGEVYTSTFNDMEKLEIQLSVDFHNTSSEMNYVRLSKASLRCIGFEVLSSELSMFTDPFIHTRTAKQLNIPGLDLKNCHTAALLKLNPRIKESKLILRFGILFLHYEDKDRMRKYKLQKFQTALFDSLENSKRNIDELEHIYVR